jgi:arylformamidase
VTAYYDISIPLSSRMPVWPGDPGIQVDRVASIGPKNNFNVTRLQLGVHALTHVDAPYHVMNDGPTVDRLPLDALIGPAVVVEPRPLDNLITATDLGQLGIRHTERILIKTRNSDLWLGGPFEFEREFVALALDAARWLVSKGVKLVGVDYLSVEPFSAPEPVVHRTLLRNGVVIVEGLNLSHVPEGRYQLMCLPLKVQGADGAPARAVLAR